jgi:hypothetical protein
MIALKKRGRGENPRPRATGRLAHDAIVTLTLKLEQ